jgi:hypothetical protein
LEDLLVAALELGIIAVASMIEEEEVIFKLLVRVGSLLSLYSARIIIGFNLIDLLEAVLA